MFDEKNAIQLLGRDGRSRLARLIGRVESSLIIVCPFVSEAGYEFVAEWVSEPMKKSGHVTIVTNLSANNVCQGATDPGAIAKLRELAPFGEVRHLPTLHAKIYIGDTSRAIVTSANLTAGGLYRNDECGIEISDHPLVAKIAGETIDLASVGAVIGEEVLGVLDSLAEDASRMRRSSEAAMTSAVQVALDAAVRQADDTVIAATLAGKTMHGVFANTISYLLRRHGPLATDALHPLVAEMHPDLCDNSVDRVINGKHFGKKWKHAVRSAQQQLKRQGRIVMNGEVWQLS